MSPYWTVDYAMLVTPLGLLVLSIRRCRKAKQFQFSIKDLLCLPWLLLPACLLKQFPPKSDLPLHDCLVVGSFHVSGGIFFWCHSMSKVGSWSRSLKLFIGAFVLTFPYAVIRLIGVFIAFFGSKYSDSNAWAYVIGMNVLLVGFCWLSGSIISPTKIEGATQQNIQ